MSNSLNFYRSYKTIIDMLYNRGYEKYPLMSYEEFKDKSRSELAIKTKLRQNYKIHRDPVNVYFPDEEKVGVKPIRTYKNEMSEENVKNAIIIVIDGVTSFARCEILGMSRDLAEPINIEIFSETEMIFDITTHELNPKFELLTITEKTEILEKYSIKENALPKMLITDPISRYYGLKKGDMVKITRSSETAGSYILYKIVL